MRRNWLAISTFALFTSGGVLGAAVAASAASGTSFDRIQLAYSPVIRDIQAALNSLGYNAGPIDGLMGTRTRSAITAYEWDNGLLVTGQPSAVLLDHIETTLAVREVPEPAQPGSDRVAQIQSELRQRGYSIATVDGRMDAETELAIRSYERASGLAVTGLPSTALLAHVEKRGDDDQSEGRTYADQVRFAQSRLNALGYEARPADGVLGPKTRDAIRAYESDAGAPITGQVSASLVDRLQIDTSTGPEPPDTDEQQPAGWSDKLDVKFRDGNFTSNPRWSVHAGRIDVRRGALVSQVASSGPDSLLGGGERNLSPAEQIGRTLVTGFLESLIAGGSRQA